MLLLSRPPATRFLLLTGIGHHYESIQPLYRTTKNSDNEIKMPGQHQIAPNPVVPGTILYDRIERCFDFDDSAGAFQDPANELKSKVWSCA